MDNSLNKNAQKLFPNAEPVTERGQKTREHILLISRHRLNEDGYHKLRIVDIAKTAKVPLGLIYHYFRNKAALCDEILEMAAEEWFTALREAPFDDDSFISIENGVSVIVDFYRNNPGIMRCFKDRTKNPSAVISQWVQNDQKLYASIADNMIKRTPALKMPYAQRLAAAFAMRGLCDSLLDEIFLHRNETVADAFGSDKELTRFLSILWYRTLFGATPATQHLGPFADFIDMQPPASR